MFVTPITERFTYISVTSRVLLQCSYIYSIAWLTECRSKYVFIYNKTFYNTITTHTITGQVVALLQITPIISKYKNSVINKNFHFEKPYWYFFKCSFQCHDRDRNEIN